MTDFRDLLKVIQSHGSGGNSFRMFKALEMGPFRLSIQASYTHYCSPRVTLEDLKSYLSWEMVLYENDKPEINPIQDSRFTDVGVPHWSDVGAHIPTAIVRALYERCRLLFVTADLSPPKQCKNYKNLKCYCNDDLICNNALSDPSSSIYSKEPVVVVDSLTAGGSPDFGKGDSWTVCVICGAKGTACEHITPVALKKKEYLKQPKNINFGAHYSKGLKFIKDAEETPEFWENYEGPYKKTQKLGAPYSEFVTSPLTEYNFEDIKKKLMAKWAPELLEAASPKAEVTDVKVEADGVVTGNIKLPTPTPYLNFNYTIPVTDKPCGVCDAKEAAYAQFKQLAEANPIPVEIKSQYEWDVDAYEISYLQASISSALGIPSSYLTDIHDEVIVTTPVCPSCKANAKGYCEKHKP
jgi:hypothetical protein